MEEMRGTLRNVPNCVETLRCGGHTRADASVAILFEGTLLVPLADTRPCVGSPIMMIRVENCRVLRVYARSARSIKVQLGVASSHKTVQAHEGECRVCARLWVSCSLVRQSAGSVAALGLRMIASCRPRIVEVLHRVPLRGVGLHVAVQHQRRAVVALRVKVIEVDVRQVTHAVCVRRRRAGADRSSDTRNGTEHRTCEGA